MSEFDFGSLSSTSGVSSVSKRLAPWGIYSVKFMGARKETIKGKKDTSAIYDILKVRFEGEEGYYEESIFYPKEGDDQRPTYINRDGHEYQGASSFERSMTFIAQVSEVLNPEGFKKMQEMSSSFKSFDDVVKAFITITDKAKGKETKLKLIGRTQNGSVVAALPKFVAVNKNGEKFACDNFIGDNVFFSPYEENKIKEFKSAKPTDMSNTEEPSDLPFDSDVKGSEDIDFSSLL